MCVFFLFLLYFVVVIDDTPCRSGVSKVGVDDCVMLSMPEHLSGEFMVCSGQLFYFSGLAVQVLPMHAIIWFVFNG